MQQYRIKHFGRLPPFHDPRDYSPQLAASKLADTVDKQTTLNVFKKIEEKKLASSDLKNEQWLPPVRDQGNLGSCVSFAWITAMEYLHKMLYRRNIEFSQLYTYKMGRDYAFGTGYQGDTGLWLKHGIMSLVRHGALDAHRYPYDINVFDEYPPAHLHGYADDFKAVKYFRLDYPNIPIEERLQRVNKYIAGKWPVVCGFYCFESLDYPKNPGEIPYPSPGEGVIGGHAICFTKDTELSLLNGTEKSFGELMDEGIDDFWVYSCDPKGNIVPGHAHSIRKTGENKPLVKITLDNNEEIKCTENHLFMMRDGSYKEALQLAIGDSLMPLYRKRSESKNMPDYEIVYNPADNRWYYTHRRVFIEINGPYSPEYNKKVKMGLIEPPILEYRRKRRQGIYKNHKVIRVEKIGSEDVYDITVDKYHNFALTAGVFVHNCLYGYDDNKEITNPNDGSITKGAWKFRNSWSEFWGENGDGWIPYDYLTKPHLSDPSFILADEFYSVTKGDWLNLLEP